MEELTQSLTQAADLCRKYGLSAQELERGAGLAEEYRVRVAVLGAFNTGKSALTNGLLNTRLVRVSAEEETRLPVEICYGSQGVTLLRDGRAFRSDPTVLRAADGALEGAQMARVCLPLPALAELPGISLLDTPGVGTPQAVRSTMLPGLIRDAGAYILVFGADAPVITESMAAFLSALPLGNKPVLCVLTKCDQFSPEQQQTIAAYLEESLAEQLGLQVRLCRVSCTADTRPEGVPEFLQALQVRAGELRDAEARRCLLAGTAHAVRYLKERIRSRRLLEPELARKADLLDERLERLNTVVEEMNQRAARLVEQTAEDAARRSRDTLAPLAAPLADLLTAGQDPAPFADGAVLSVIHAEARSHILPVLASYEKTMRRVASLYGLTIPAREVEPETLMDSAFPGTETLFGSSTAPDALSDALQALVEQCLCQGGREAFRQLSRTLSDPLYEQLASLRKALEDTRRQQHEQAAASSQTLEELQNDLARLRQMTGRLEEGSDDV